MKKIVIYSAVVGLTLTIMLLAIKRDTIEFLPSPAGPTGLVAATGCFEQGYEGYGWPFPVYARFCYCNCDSEYSLEPTYLFLNFSIFFVPSLLVGTAYSMIKQKITK